MRLADQLDRFSPYMLAVLRIVTALIFMEHGTQKILGFPPGSSPQPPFFSVRLPTSWAMPQRVSSRPITEVMRQFSTASSSSTSCLLALEPGASTGTTLISS
jgi:uncharacterized membrane protein YphA (DoxX/SURF4 family)